MYERILVPTDGSDGTERAIEHALASAGDETTIHALSVADRRLYLSADKDDQEEVLERLREEGERAVEAAVEQIEAAGRKAVGVVREGIPHDEIVSVADEEDIDLVVIGSHGRTGREKIVHMGSVTERVISNIGRPVLVVDIGPEDASELEASVGVESDHNEAEEAS